MAYFAGDKFLLTRGLKEESDFHVQIPVFARRKSWYREQRDRDQKLRSEDDYSTPNDSFRLTLYSTTLPSFTIAFCPTTSTPRTFLTVLDDLFTASLMASSKPLLEVPTSSIIFPTGIFCISSPL